MRDRSFRAPVKTLVHSCIVVCCVGGAVQAQTWLAHTKPEIIGDLGVAISDGSAFADDATIIVHTGQKLKFFTISADSDKKIEGSTTIFADDEPWIEWGKTGGAWTGAATRTKSGIPIEWTAPAVVGDYEVTAKADDKSLLRDEDNGEIVTLNIKVVDACPTGITLSGPCTHTPDWADNLTFGYLRVKHCVEGDPPDPPDSWDGLQLTEVLDVDDATTCTDAMLHQGNPLGSFCGGTSTFSVGGASALTFSCTGTAQEDCFYDNHRTRSNLKLYLRADAGPDQLWSTADDDIKGPCKVVCTQKYYCHDIQNPVGTFTVTRNFEIIYVVLNGVIVPRCKVTITKS